MPSSNDPVLAFLESCTELAAFCSQNGWISNESIRYEILQQQPGELLIYVTFLESIMEGSGCQCDEKSCYGRLRLALDDSGRIIAAEIA